MSEYKEIRLIKPILKETLKKRFMSQIKSAITESENTGSAIIQQSVDSIIEHIDDDLLQRLALTRQAATEATKLEEAFQIQQQIEKIIDEEANKAAKVFAETLKDAAIEALNETLHEVTKPKQ